MLKRDPSEYRNKFIIFLLVNPPYANVLVRLMGYLGSIFILGINTFQKVAIKAKNNRLGFFWYVIPQKNYIMRFSKLGKKKWNENKTSKSNFLPSVTLNCPDIHGFRH